MQRVNRRIGDKRVLALLKAFLKAECSLRTAQPRNDHRYTPGGNPFAVLANVALSVLDDHFAKAWEAMGDSNDRAYRRRKGLATYRLVRYADDFVVLVAGSQNDAAGLREEIARALTPMGLRLSEEKTRLSHRRGFDFLGWRSSANRSEAVPSATSTRTVQEGPSGRLWSGADR